MGVVKVVSPFTIVHLVVGTWHPGGGGVLSGATRPKPSLRRPLLLRYGAHAVCSEYVPSQDGPRGASKVSEHPHPVTQAVQSSAGRGSFLALVLASRVEVQPQGHRAQFRGHGLVLRLAVFHVPAAQGEQLLRNYLKKQLPMKAMPEQRSRPLQQGQAIDCLLVVAHKFPTALGQPIQGPFHHPAPRWMALLTVKGRGRRQVNACLSVPFACYGVPISVVKLSFQGISKSSRIKGGR